MGCVLVDVRILFRSRRNDFFFSRAIAPAEIIFSRLFDFRPSLLRRRTFFFGARGTSVPVARHGGPRYSRANFPNRTVPIIGTKSKKRNEFTSYPGVSPRTPLNSIHYEASVRPSDRRVEGEGPRAPPRREKKNKTFSGRELRLGAKKKIKLSLRLIKLKFPVSTRRSYLGWQCFAQAQDAGWPPASGRVMGSLVWAVSVEILAFL